MLSIGPGAALSRSGAGAHDLGACFAETTLPLPVFINGLHEFRFLEIRPQDLREIELGVGRLPQKKIAQTAFAAGPDEQVRIGQTGGIEMFSQEIFGNILRV